MENKGYPNKEIAINLWENGIKYRKSKPYGFDVEEEYIFHTKGVAAAAKKIAEYLPVLDPEKAYILGLLHDYGKRISEKIENYFHGLEGYDQMLKLGYPEVAKICLTHTFFDKNFDYSDFSYPVEWLEQVKTKLQKIEYDDYDYLICLCDKFFEGLKIVPIEKRAEGIAKRYKTTDRQIKIFREKSLLLKKYFDKKTGKDIYKILQIEKI